MPWRYGKETIKAHSLYKVFLTPIHSLHSFYLCHMCSYELKGAFYFGKIFGGLSSPMPGARSQTPTPLFHVIIGTVQLVTAPDPMAAKPKLCVFVYTKATVFCCPGLSIRTIDR